ncbi:hypothetical protein GCM10020331_069570 [Ectobacillus funiculus]
MKLTEAEIAMIPILIQLRRLDVFLHFLGRHWDGIDPVETVQKNMCMKLSEERIGWM